MWVYDVCLCVKWPTPLPPTPFLFFGQFDPTLMSVVHSCIANSITRMGHWTLPEGRTLELFPVSPLYPSAPSAESCPWVLFKSDVGLGVMLSVLALWHVLTCWVMSAAAGSASSPLRKGGCHHTYISSRVQGKNDHWQLTHFPVSQKSLLMLVSSGNKHGHELVVVQNKNLQDFTG